MRYSFAHTSQISNKPHCLDDFSGAVFLSQAMDKNIRGQYGGAGAKRYHMNVFKMLGEFSNPSNERTQKIIIFIDFLSDYKKIFVWCLHAQKYAPKNTSKQLNIGSNGLWYTKSFPPPRIAGETNPFWHRSTLRYSIFFLQKTIYIFGASWNFNPFFFKKI